MGSDRLTAFRLTDFTIPLAVISNEKIASVIYEDNTPQAIPDVVNQFWIGITTGTDLVGCYQVEQKGQVLWQGHAHVLPEYRKEYSLEATKTAMRWCAENIPGLNTIICHIPTAHPNVVEHVLKAGMRKVGTIPQCYLFRGELVDIVILTITKEDIEKWEKS